MGVLRWVERREVHEEGTAQPIAGNEPRRLTDQNMVYRLRHEIHGDGWGYGSCCSRRCLRRPRCGCCCDRGSCCFRNNCSETIVLVVVMVVPVEVVVVLGLRS